MRGEDIRVGLRCDAGPALGVGHLARCIALAEELMRRGVEIVLLGDVGGLPWAERQLSARDLPRRSAPADPAALAQIAVSLGLAAVVIDGYHLDPTTARRLREVGVTTLALADGPFGSEQDADILLDQNLGAEGDHSAGGAAHRLTGLPYVLLRDLVVSRRPAEAPTPRPAEPNVLCVFGGTDPTEAATILPPLIAATSVPCAIRVVAADKRIAAAVHETGTAVGQTIEVVQPVDDLPSLAAEADVVVTASGSSVWEMLCLGRAVALVAVSDNQRLAYARVVDAGLARGLGWVEALRSDAAVRTRAVEELRRLLAEPDQRVALARRGWAAVDGRGRERVADVLLNAVTAGPR